MNLSEESSKSNSIAERAKRRIPIPAWAIGAGALGCIALGMALVMAFGDRGDKTTAPPAVVVGPTLAPITPSSTPAVNVAPTPPVVANTPPAAAAGVVSNVAPAPTAATPEEAQATPVPDATSAVVAPGASGPTFEELYINTSTGTQAQRDAYWATVKNTSVSWRGSFESLGSAPDGPVIIRCKVGNSSIPVKVTLSTSPLQTLPPLQSNQSITVEGVLAAYSNQGFELVQGRVN